MHCGLTQRPQLPGERDPPAPLPADNGGRGQLNLHDGHVRQGEVGARGVGVALAEGLGDQGVVEVPVVAVIWKDS